MPAHRRQTPLLRPLLCPLLRHRPTTPRPVRYTMTGLMNVLTSPHGWSDRHDGFQPWHPLAEARDPQQPGQPLTFTIDATDPATAAIRARAIGEGRSVDLHRAFWPTTLRRMAVGDVLALTTADRTTPYYFALAPGHLTELPCINTPIPFAALLTRCSQLTT